ncbi:MAG: TatD family hydrolase [Pseudomonadota bacterium]
MLVDSPLLVDSHCHLDYLEKENDLDEIVGRAERAGVGTMVTICTKLSEFERIKGIAQSYDRVFCSVGVHPHEAAEEGQETSDRLIELTRHDKVVGIGETGLDYYYEHSPRQAQRISFLAHIDAARQTGLPLIVHSRDAEDDSLSILQSEHEKAPFPAVIHCFTGSAQLARACLDMGFSISLAGVVTFKSAQALRDVALEIPSDRLLVETDSPYLAPVPKRGKTNEPANVIHTAQFLAELRGVPLEDLAGQTSDNFFNLFSKVPRSSASA